MLTQNRLNLLYDNDVTNYNEKDFGTVNIKLLCVSHTQKNDLCSNEQSVCD